MDGINSRYLTTCANSVINNGSCKTTEIQIIIYNNMIEKQTDRTTTTQDAVARSVVAKRNVCSTIPTPESQRQH
jgi:hypothetical protein